MLPERIRAKRFSISFPPALLRAVDKYADAKFGGNRSAALVAIAGDFFAPAEIAKPKAAKPAPKPRTEAPKKKASRTK